MRARPLRQQQKSRQDQHRDDGRSDRPAQGETAMISRLIEEIPDRRAKRPGQDERRPEQQDPRQIGPVIGESEHHEAGGEDKRPAFVAEAGAIGHPVAERGPQGLGKGDRQPVEGFDFRHIDRFHRYRALRPVPRAEHGKHAEKQNR